MLKLETILTRLFDGVKTRVWIVLLLVLSLLGAIKSIWTETAWATISVGISLAGLGIYFVLAALLAPLSSSILRNNQHFAAAKPGLIVVGLFLFLCGLALLFYKGSFVVPSMSGET